MPEGLNKGEEKKVFENQDDKNLGEEKEFSEFNSELQNELSEFKKEAQDKTRSLLGAMLWFDKFNEKFKSVDERIKKIKGIMPKFVLSKDNKERIEELNKVKEELEKIKQEILKGNQLGVDGLLGRFSKNE